MDEAGSKQPRSVFFRVVVAFFLCGLAIVLLGLPLFLSAGSLRFTKAWLFLGAINIPWFLILTYLAVKDPALFERRTTAREEERSQMLLKLLLTGILLIALVICGLDFRHHWSNVPLIVVIVFTVVLILGNIMLFVVVKQNRYGSRAIEIQEDQQVVEAGLYSVVRHPMYLAFAIIFCPCPLVLGSFYALILTLFMPILIAMRIRSEEQLLQKRLEGYSSYMRKVRFRLIPHIW
jgi:protein-S-isoprenylcysteine O-methyltransferase Ste14